MSLYHDEELINLEQESEENIVLGRHFTIGEIKKHIKESEKIISLQVQTIEELRLVVVWENVPLTF